MKNLDFFKIPQYLTHATKKTNKKSDGFLYVLNSEDFKTLAKIIKKEAHGWQASKIISNKSEVIYFSGKRGPVWVLIRQNVKGPFSHSGLLEESNYTWFREQAGSILQKSKSEKVKKLSVEILNSDASTTLGLLTGFELAAYSFKNTGNKTSFDNFPEISLSRNVDSNLAQQAMQIAAAVNSARHLVNLPPNYLNPKTFSDAILNQFKKNKNIEIEVWDFEKLKKENMGLHVGVGQGAEHLPCMVHVKYRPKASSKNKQMKPVAFVGKGITFDTGGIDIKPSSAMRLMKKDMGGAAALFGILNWACDSHYPNPLDFYFGLAENSVDSKAMRPSDVLTARNGLKVEIHNTDAEGRLVLADCLDVAVTQKNQDEPEIVIDLATLTGAIKVALGADIAGLFCNEDSLSDQLSKASQASGDLSWRMPMYSKYTSSFSSNFADMVNAVDGFGGAITAALFLEKFVKNKPWAHLDIYAWNDKPTGSFSFAGGSGQGVQMMIEWLRGRVYYGV